jgi:hypothetical protein
MSTGMCHTSHLSVGVYHIVRSYVCRRIPYRACLRVYAIQRYVCGHVPRIALVCRRIPYHTELCPQAYTLSYRAMSASVYRTVLVCRCMPYSVMSAGMYHTSRLSVGVYHIVQSYVCRRTPCSACLQMYAIQRLSVGVYHIVQSYVCKRIPYSACLQVYAIQRCVCGHVPHIALVCRCIPYRTELCLQVYTVQCLSAGVCHTVLCLRACTIHRVCL